MGRARRRKKAKITYIKFMLLVVLCIAIFFLIKSTRAKYRSSAQSNANVDIAYYVLEEGSISQDLKLESILPSPTPYNYLFSVANNDGTNRTETAIDYTIEIKTTTNLPVTYRLYNQEDLTSEISYETETKVDSDGTYFRYIYLNGGTFGFTQDEEEVFDLQVEFPMAYNLAQYEGIVEYVQITIKSSQKIE